MRVLSTVLASSALALLIAWFIFVDAPDPKTLCRHITEITVAEAKSSSLSESTQDSLVQQLETRCIEHKRNKILLRGKLKYADYARCVMKGRSLREIEGC